MSDRTLVITGGHGLCGRELVRHFESLDGWIVYTVDRKPLDRPNHLQFDLRDPVPLGKYGFPKQIDAAIHTAADVDQTTDAYSVIDSNVRATFNTATYARDAGAKHLLNFSSATVYGVPPNLDTNRETDRSGPTTNYGLSKVLAEQVIASIGRDMATADLRLGYVLGRGVPERGMIARFARALQNGDPIRLENPDATAIQFLDTRDLAEICQRFLDQRIVGTFNVASPDVTTLRQVFDCIARNFPASKSSIERIDAPQKILRTILPTDRLIESLGPLTFRPVAESIEYALCSLNCL